jgi:hypothetical protein
MTGQELVKGRVDQADDDRQAIHGAEEAQEILALEGQEDGQALVDHLRVVLVEDHPLHVRQAVLLEEHVLGAAEADALGAVLSGALGVDRVVGVGPHLEAAGVVGPGEELLEIRVAEIGDHRGDGAGVDVA